MPPSGDFCQLHGLLPAIKTNLAVTLLVTMLDSWCFNAKYANYLHDCYDQFLWSLSFLLK